MKETLLFLFLSVSLSAGRNITSKKNASETKNNADFFFSQSVLFLSAVTLLFVFGIGKLYASLMTVLYGIIYGLLLIVSQWMFTLSLRRGETSICTVIYSLGFILPTLSGTLFWNEEFSFLSLIGLVLALCTVLLTAKREVKKEKSNFRPFVILAMSASGGLGIMQKVQQNSKVSNETFAFLLIAFSFAFIVSLIAFLLCKEKLNSKNPVYSVVAGLCFGGANLFNTTLAGRLNSSVFFPVQNISTILLSTLLGILFFKEKVTKKTALVIVLGLATVIVFSI